MKAGYKCFSGNVLKLIAAVSMLIDHTGVIFFPGVEIFRIIGRTAFPIFSYMIYEGCRYTGNKAAYLLRMALLGVGMSVLQLAVTGMLEFNVLITFSCSVSLIFILQLAAKERDTAKATLRYALFASLTMFFFFMCEMFFFDYSFFGIILPVFPAAAELLLGEGVLKSRIEPRMIAFSLGLVLLSVYYGGVQPYCLFSLVLLALYNGKRGVKLPKYAFYVFYPAHIALLWTLELFI